MLNYQKVSVNRHGQNVGSEAHVPVFSKFTMNTIVGRWMTLTPFKEIAENPNIFRTLWRTLEREHDEARWTYLPYDKFKTPDQLEDAIRSNFGYFYDSQYVIQVGHQAMGWLGLINMRLEDRVIELGNIYFAEPLKQTTAATEAIFHILDECFIRGFRKVEWKCNDLNEPAVNAALRLGFLYEGTLRQDKVIKGLNCNTACFSILDEEWVQIRQALELWLKQYNFEIDRTQKVRLEEFMRLFPITGRAGNVNENESSEV